MIEANSQIDDVLIVLHASSFLVICMHITIYET